MSNTPAVTLLDMAASLATLAYSKYHANYDNALYLAAVGDDYEKGIRLGDTALALCGHPACVIDHSFGNDKEALAFLAKFI